MIVDLLRNDVSRIAQPHSVKVPHLFTVQTLPTVLQMVSDVTAVTRPGTTLCEVFSALFPCGSVTGAPKVQAMRMIKSLEPDTARHLLRRHRRGAPRRPRHLQRGDSHRHAARHTQPPAALAAASRRTPRQRPNGRNGASSAAFWSAPASRSSCWKPCAWKTVFFSIWMPTWPGCNGRQSTLPIRWMRHTSGRS